MGSPAEKQKPDFCFRKVESTPIEPGKTFSLGRPPYNTKREKEEYLKLRKAEKQRILAEKKKKKFNKSRAKTLCTIPTPRAFPLSPERANVIGIFLEWTLAHFPKNSIQAVQHFYKLIAPPLPGSKKFYVLTKETISILAREFFSQLRYRWTFRKFLNLILQKKSKKINEVDPITMEPFHHPIVIQNLNARSIYTFESKTLAKMWSTNLLQHDGLFMEPRSPINPLTNLPFNILELQQGIQQLRKNGHLDWVLDSFSACQYQMKEWKQKFGMPLRVEAIQNVFCDVNSNDRYDMLMDFIELQHDIHGQRFDKRFYDWVLHSDETKDFAHMWSIECKRYYIDKYTAFDKDDIDDLEVRTSIYCAKLVDTPQIVKTLYQNFLDSKRKRRNVGHMSVTISFPNNPELPVVNRIISQGNSRIPASRG